MKLSNRQEDVFNALKDNQELTELTGVYRKCRNQHLTLAQLETFNKHCSSGKKRIQWHAPTWVAMDRKSFDTLITKAYPPNSDILMIDEYYEEAPDGSD